MMSSSAAMPPSSAAAVAAPAAVVTPTIDEDEQASFLASIAAMDGGVALAQPQQCHPTEPQQQPQLLLHQIESILDATLPSSGSLASPSAEMTLENYIGNDADAMESIASLAHAAATMATPPAKSQDAPQETIQGDPQGEPSEVAEAAGILCNFKNGVIANSPEDVAEIVDMAVEMLTVDARQEQDDDDGDEAYEPEGRVYCQPVRDGAAPAAAARGESLVHPDRLATPDDAEEVNRLHQYVRRDLLEIFVVPNTEAGDDSDEDDEDEDDEEHTATKKQKTSTGTSTTATSDTRRLVTRRRSIPISTSAVSTNSVAHRHYPGRVGLRCVHCADVRATTKNGKSTVASKAAFYPLRLKNIYREVCAWQRIHFKNCKHVPDDVRVRYDHYKAIDTSRGKVRYWETSARKIGLVNNPERDDGVVFATTAWKA